MPNHPKTALYLPVAQDEDQDAPMAPAQSKWQQFVGKARLAYYRAHIATYFGRHDFLRAINNNETSLVVGVLDAGFKADGEGLLLAVTYGNAKMVAAMLAKNVLMNCHHDGKCPVQMAVFQRHKNILQMLLQHLRDKHETERFTQRSAFQIAQAGKLDDYVQLLRAYPDVADLREDKLPKYKAPLLISQPSAAAQPLLPHPPRSELRRRIPGPGLKMEM